jgi:threonine dehydrogenase-like Zn-dependent dehydrogenase
MNETALPSTMQGLWLENMKLSMRRDIICHRPGPGEALIRVRLAGICQTDLELRKGYYPFVGIPGHEFVGRIALAPDRPSWEGKRVVGEINCVCGNCSLCSQHLPHHCLERTVLGIVGRNGAFAEYLILPLTNLHPVPDALSDEKAVFTEPLAAALQILEQVQIGQDQKVLLIGAGKLGQLISRVLLLTGCALSVVARHESQASLLSQLELLLVDENEMPNKHFDIVVEASGAPQGLERARLAVRPAGTIVLKSTYEGKSVVDLSSLVVDEITLVGSRCGPFPTAIDLLERDVINPTPLISETRSFCEATEAFDRASESGVLKVLIQL